MQVGFLDYQFTNYHMKKFLELLRGDVGKGSVAVSLGWELSRTEEGKSWCEENHIKYCDSVDEVIDKSDAIIALAPNNPEQHLALTRVALQAGKPVFLDKTLAETPDDSQQILTLAHKHKTPIMSASSLRFATELDEFDNLGLPETVFARGLGKFPVYAIHTLTMALRFFGPDIQRVIDTGEDGTRLVTLDDGKRRASVEVRDSKNPYETTPWQVGVRTGGMYRVATVKDFDGFYANLMKKVLEFFTTGQSAIAPAEMLANVTVQAAAEESFAAGGTWVHVRTPAAG